MLVAVFDVWRQEAAQARQHPETCTQEEQEALYSLSLPGGHCASTVFHTTAADQEAVGEVQQEIFHLMSETRTLLEALPSPQVWRAPLGEYGAVCSVTRG